MGKNNLKKKQKRKRTDERNKKTNSEMTALYPTLSTIN